MNQHDAFRYYELRPAWVGVDTEKYGYKYSGEQTVLGIWWGLTLVDKPS